MPKGFSFPTISVPLNRPPLHSLIFSSFLFLSSFDEFTCDAAGFIWTHLPHRFKSSLKGFLFEDTLHIFFLYEHYAVVSYFFSKCRFKNSPPLTPFP